MISSHSPQRPMFPQHPTIEHNLLATETGEGKDERQRQENVDDSPDSEGPARWSDLSFKLIRDVARGFQKWI